MLNAAGRLLLSATLCSVLCGLAVSHAQANEADDSFAAAADQYTAKHWDVAVEGFRKFLHDYPDSTKHAKAMYFQAKAARAARSQHRSLPAVHRCAGRGSVRIFCETGFIWSRGICRPQWPKQRGPNPSAAISVAIPRRQAKFENSDVSRRSRPAHRRYRPGRAIVSRIARSLCRSTRRRSMPSRSWLTFSK